ncbi:hypothetical protein [Nostoc sp. 'Peltigera membranacea cyanobiont' 232]|uniref:hypothetical protein n=1 Tax=Nostoc sp. 'Peltigera membranacea cyanobiont' 232 TaxID=2014531 RepID=UPI000B9EEFD1|nr:hypothetical protein [Nostoc sp. 'Peltigera membranacea cyanobiont' 232]OYD96080.1 hypothetical protein CDG79_40415 [Nostoc sp. 'Peltigera membranacea cyanobiont' 232]
MSVATLQQVFGANATQDATTVTIHKADFASVGFTPATANTADSILAAIVAFAETNIPDSAVTGGDTTRTVGIADGYQTITTVGTSQLLVLPKTINFYSPFNGTFDPDNY